MSEQIIYIKEGKEGYYEEKKSKFIAMSYPVNSEEEVSQILEIIRKKYWDARHNCYAFVIGENNEVTRCSDDGEPSGTAGKPILEVLLGSGVHNCLVVVTRYFGGTLLGTGGLVRAYQKAASDSLLASSKCISTLGRYLNVNTDYNGFGKLQYMAEKQGVQIEEVKYGADVQIKIAVPEAKADALIKSITEMTAGKAVIDEEKNVRLITDFSH